MSDRLKLSRDAWRALAVALLFVCGLLGVALVLERSREPLVVGPEQEVDVVPPTLVLKASSFDELPGWVEDDLEGLGLALSRSCRVWAARDEDQQLSTTGLGGRAGDWRDFCSEAGVASVGELREVIERWLQPWSMADREDPEALLTGYYEASLRGSRSRSEEFSVPLYRRPPELVSVNLGSFREDLRGRRLAGQVSSGRLEPYADREALEQGALEGRGLELVWVDSAVDAFFLHIQGSGRVDLQNGEVLRVGYADQNGHAYRAIGRDLVQSGAMSLEEVSMQSIRLWLEQNPEAGQELMEGNPSFVFFRELEGEGPLGSQGVALTPRRSLAVDRKFVPLGLPVWVDSTLPTSGPEEVALKLQTLLVAQDTGGAIRGPLRGDVFWGHGEEAAEIAGRMRQPARMWLLLPRGQEPPSSGSEP